MVKKEYKKSWLLITNQDFLYYKFTKEKIAYNIIQIITPIVFHDFTNLHTNNDVIVVIQIDTKDILLIINKNIFIFIYYPIKGMFTPQAVTRSFKMI